ncbi:BTAD domain-containing putative transcriptional regulator [Mycobacterium sp. 1482292.6]|uniref:BTAD domain-containing putative transcriptional regulator n=1 Tax=Mycobacterium sp. 1482292.6 TaxID=1834081 RepID=UPI0009F5DBF8|nr:BTAD domain-containing putative transcriptional regulator [Mycobacterium sp. 1482292.6]
MELGVLGPLQVRQDGTPVAIPGAKPRAILTMLGLHGGSVVPADTLVELLWGEEPPRTAAKALQTHISSLRRALGDGFVLTQGAGWVLADSEIDASRYKSAARLGRDAAAAGDTSQAVARFEEALALWRGIPELPDGRPGTSEKTRWIESHAALVEDRADALLATGRAAEVIGDLEAAVAEAPLRERRWGQLMLALYRAGRQGEALGAYQRARSLLADELGVDPGPNLRRLEAAIVAQDASLDVAVAQHAPSVTRAVTFLLTDIEGSTAAWEADADAMAVALARHDELVEQVVTSRGGRLIKTRGEGDATFSVFDRPSAAASAAVELQDAIAHEPWVSRDPIRVRMALHTGEVELRDGDYFGRAVNRVARLRSLAEGGQILCSGATAELVIDTLADDVLLTDLGMRQLKNLARPEHVFELRLETGVEQPESHRAEAAPLERPGLPAVLVGPGPFVGRGRELEGLLSAWQTALAGGVRTVLIAGEPGVGKTRLAGEWSQRAYELGAIVLYGRCDEDLGAPYQPFAEALRSLVPCMGPDRLRGLRGVEALLSLVPGLADVVPDLVRPAHSDPDTERYALFDAVVALLETASTSAPVLLVLDDLHWAAKPTLLLLRHLLRFGDHARVQIVGTYRSTDLDRAHPLAATLADLHRDGTANRLNLGGLDEDDVTTYVAEAGYDDEELAHALASVTGGNPFFLIEALRHVDESGGVWDQSTLPQGVREAVSRRLSRLPVETNKALAAAAVIGSRFAVELVEQVVGTDLVDAFDEARQAGIVIEEPGGFYRFNHAIVRQSLLAELASVRRMRLHQRIATTLETSPGAEDELLAELAHHYFECAWAGNAAKAVFYCRRAADQAMARLAYEGAADLYHRALHALEEIDDELPDRDDQTVELLVARCEALLAAGDVASAAGAVSQLQAATVDSARLAAWATCFDGQLTMLIHPERLDEVETALGAAAAKLAELDDPAGEAKAHTVRAGCLARLGRIGDCEVALDDALTAARRAREHRRVNAVLAGAPLAALWGPNPVPRAGGRCLDVVRLLRITTDSPAVEATSTRCQAVLEAFRGRTAAARRMIDSARRTVTELGLRHALLEVEQFAGIVELIGNDPAAAETHLRKAYNGFRRMGLDADTAETAALLGRACLALDRESEAAELCTESERLAGHALKASIAWRTLRAHLLARGDDYDAARQVAEAAVTLAERTDALVDHGDACLTLATVLGRGGDMAAARTAAGQAVDLYERKGAAALADMARAVLGENAVPPAPAPPEAPVVELDNACVRVGERVVAAINREAWDEFEQLFAPDGLIESRRKIVGFGQLDVPPGEFPRVNRRVLETVPMRLSQRIVAVRGERLALARLVIGADDATPGAPQDEFVLLYGIDEDGQICLQVWFDVEDMDAAMAELTNAYARPEEIPSRAPLANAATRAYERLHAYFAARDWDAITELLTEDYYGDDRRSVVGAGIRRGPGAAIEDYRSAADIEVTDATSDTVATRGGRLALVRARYSRSGLEPGAFRVDFLQIVEIDTTEQIAAMAAFDLNDFDAAIAELDRRYLAGEAAPHARTWSIITRAYAAVNRREPPPTTPDWVNLDHRRARAFAPGDLAAYLKVTWDLLTPGVNIYIEAVHRLTALGAVVTRVYQGISREGFDAEWREVGVSTVKGDLIDRSELFDETDLGAAIARFEELDRRARRLENAATRVVEHFLNHLAAGDWPAIAEFYAEDVSTYDRRRVVAAEVIQGRDANVANWRVLVDIAPDNLTSTTVATRGERLTLTRVHSAAFQTDVLNLLEIDADERIKAVMVFDLENFDAAMAELEARYLAGEAASCARTWSAVARSYAALNRHEPPLTSPDCVNVDHRRETAFGPGDVSAYINAGWDSRQDTNIYVEQVHRLSDAGTVITYAAQEFSPEGLRAEWRGLAVFAVADDEIHRTEVFDEADIDAAITRFEELGRLTPELENAASRVFKHVWSHFAAGDWDAMAQTVADDYVGIDHRRVVSADTQHGRDDVIRDLQAAAGVGFTISMVSAIAIRGERLVLARSRATGSDPGGVQNDALNVFEVDADDRIARVVSYDMEDFDAAVAELDARYMAGEAMAHARAWSVIKGAYTALNRREHPATTADWVNIDHRRGISFAPGHVSASLNNWLATPYLSNSIEAVHRLDDLGAVVTNVTHETSREGFEAEWRGISVLTIEGDLVNRLEIFDEADLGAAIARFDQLHPRPRQLQNKASQIDDRFLAYFAARDWDSMAEMTADGFTSDDRRRVVGAGVQLGREVDIDNMRAWADVGIQKIVSDVIATRGERLFLGRTRFFGPEQGPAAFHSEVLGLIEIDAENRVLARVVFDGDDFDAAVAELDSRYLAGEASSNSRTWSLMTEAFAALSRREIPATTPDWVNIDHRRLAPIGAGDLEAFLHATWELSPRARIYIAAVHRLSGRGAVVTHVAIGTSPAGFDAEWQVVDVVLFDGDRISRTELFDEADLEEALARFDAIQAAARRPENAASRLYERFKACYAERDLQTIAKMFADNVCTEDRRRVVNSGVRPGKSAVMDEVSALAELDIDLMTEVIATRGARLVLSRVQISGPDPGHEGFSVVGLDIIELDAEGQAVARLVFDLDDIEAAFKELDARYVAGEAAAHADTWAAVAGVHAMFNRHEYPPEDWVTVDHRRGTPFTASDMTSAVHTLFDLTPDFKVHIEAVHEINSRGAVITNYAHGSSPDGVGVEWRMVMLHLVDDGRLTRCEVFDETDTEAAIARLKELSRPAPRLENRATLTVGQFLAYFAARDWEAMAGLVDEAFLSDDRRRGINAGIRRGRDVEMANWRATAEVWKSDVRATTVATRGECLAILRFTFASQDSLPTASQAAALSVVQVNDDSRCAATVVFDPEDVDGAFEELETRYLAGEASAHAHTWSAVARAYDRANRHEIPGMTANSVFVDHRAVLTTEPEKLDAYLPAVWDLMPDISVYIEAVHQLSDTGAVITHVARGASQDGFEAEWRTINVGTVEGDLMNRVEVYDEADIDAAIARFDQLSRPALKNPASQAYERICEHLDARDWDALAELTAENISVDDRRRVVNAGVISGRKANIESTRALAEVGFTLTMPSVIATRGARLALLRVRVSGRDPEAIANDALNIVELDFDRRVAADVIFDLEDIDAAFAELESRYLAGEAANHADPWSVVIGANARFNRHELPATTPDPVYIDHRPLVSIDDVELATSVGAMWDLTSEANAYIEAVHQLSGVGAVTTQVLRLRSQEGFDAELRLTYVIAVEGDLLSRIEVFDEADLDKALAKFDELHRPTQRLENAASRAEYLLFAHSAARDWAAAAEILADNSFVEDHRRVVNVGFWDGRDAMLKNMQALEEGLARVALTVIATRGERLALIRVRSFDHGLQPGEFVVEILGVTEVDSAGRIAAHVFFDVDDIDRAFEELETRYLAIETAAHGRTWSTLLRDFAAFNEHKLPLTTPDWVNLDHRRGRAFSPGDLVPYIHATWQVAPQAKIYVYAVHRLSDLGAVVTQSTHGTSPDGFDAEWLEISLFTLDGDRINRCEVFDEADLDAALARFDELTGKDQPK